MIETVQGVAYGRPATDALAARIVSIQAGDPLAPVTVVVPSNAAGLAARRVLGAASGLANVSFLTPFAVAERLGRRRTAAAGHAQLTEPILIAAIRRELRADAGFFDPVSTHAGTERALAQRYAELSRARPETVERIGRSGSARARALVDLCRRVRNRLDAYADEDSLARAAHAAVAEGDATSAGLGSLILFLPQPVPPGLRDLMVSVMAARPTTALVGLTGDPEADGPVREECARLELHLGDSAGIEISTGTEVITASDADDEVRAVVRRILALAESGIPFDRMAILFPPVEPYARIVAAQLAAAGIVRNGPSVRTLADSMPGRMLDRLLRLVGAAFARNELVALFASTPVRTPEGGAVPIDRWDRISRRAGVVDGDGWEHGLEVHARDLDDRADDRAAAGLGGEQGLRTEANSARSLAGFVADLRVRLERLERATGWADRVVEARTALLDLAGGIDVAAAWPEAEREALHLVLAALDRCTHLDVIDPTPSFVVFASTVTNELGTSVGRAGRYGDGVLCATIGTGIGLDLDAVFLVGLSEGLFPSARREDALLADADRALAGDGELATRDRARADQRRSYLAGLAAASQHRVLTHARGDLRSAREHLASRYVLETASVLAGERVFASAFDTLDHTVGVDAVPSFAAGLSRVDGAATLADRDLGEVAEFVAAGGDVLDHPLVRTSAVSVGIDAIRGRASATLTRWDGNVSTVAHEVRSPATGDVMSATRLESWSECPFRYFLTHVLRVPVEAEPERLLELSPLDRGTLVHAVLEQFIADELAKPEGERVPVGTAWTPASVARIRELVARFAADAEAKGLTGKAVLWALHREEIESDVVQFLVSDSGYRIQEGVVPVSVEFPFGWDDAPPVEITVPSGAVVRFRGRADRIDRRPDGTLVVLDYKTGVRPRAPDGCEGDPVWAGARLQLPLYAEAARQQIGAESIESAYWYVSERGGFARDRIELDDTTSTRFRVVVGQIVNGIDVGIFPAAPGEPDWFHGTEANCAYCDFDGLCPADRAAQYDAKEAAPEFRMFHDLMPEVEA